MWTRKQAARPVSGQVALPGGRTIEPGDDVLAIVDETAATTRAQPSDDGLRAPAGGVPIRVEPRRGVDDESSASERSLWLAGAAASA